MAFAFLLGLVGLAQLKMNSGYFIDESLLFASFDDNDYFYDRHVPDTLVNMRELLMFRSEGHIKNMGCLEWEPDNSLVESGEYSIEYAEEYYTEYGRWHTLVSTFDGRSWGSVEESELDSPKAKQLAEEAINEQLYQFRLAQETLGNSVGLYYYTSDGEWTLTNLAAGQGADFIRQQPVHLINEAGRATASSQSENSRINFSSPYWDRYDMSGDFTAYIGYSPEIVNWQNSQWRYLQQRLAVQVARIFAPLIAALILLVVLLAGAGRRTGEDKDKVFFIALDKPWLDIGLVFVIAFETAVIAFSIYGAGNAWRYNNIQIAIALLAMPVRKYASWFATWTT
jgi:hypothetical protein